MMVRSLSAVTASRLRLGFLPLTLNPRLSKDLGTRHRAAIGITADSDAVRRRRLGREGLISFVEGGQIRRGLDATKAARLNFQASKPSQTSAQEEKKLAPETEAETEESSLNVKP